MDMAKRIYALRAYKPDCKFFECVLVELTAKQAKTLLASDRTEYPLYEAIPAWRAHKWVRNGYIHETGLYVDDLNRIRYAEPGC